MKQLPECLSGALRSRLGLRGLCAAIIALPLLAGAASAQDVRPAAGDITVRLGAAGVMFDSSASFDVMDTAQPGADIDTSNNVTASAEVDYHFTPELSLSLTLGIPPETEVDGTGDFAPYGRLGDVRYGLGALMGKYHLNHFNRFQPFVGAGIAYFKVFEADGVAVSELEVDDAVGPVVQVGADFMLTKQIGAFASVSHAWIDTEGSGTVPVPMVGILPVEADIELDPTVIQAGLVIRF